MELRCRGLRKRGPFKRAYFFTLDALLGFFILSAGIIILSTFYIHEVPRAQIDYFSEDIMNILSGVRISEINNSYVEKLILDGNITDTDNTLLEQIGILWVTGRQNLAEELARNVSDQLIPDSYGYSFVVGNDTIYTNSRPVNKELSNYRSLITGIEKSRPILGTAARIFLTSVTEYSESKYLYFGGFVGQGNISNFIEDLPGDAGIVEMLLELEAGDNFSLYINKIKCDDFIVSGLNMTADAWDITYCNTSIVPGATNNFTIIFEDGLDDAYIAGGYLKVEYQTMEVFSKDIDSEVYHFPGISGQANLYDSFFVPGDLESMKVYLHFKSNYSTYLTIGDRLVFNTTGDGTDQEFTIDNATLTSFPVLLDYESISNSTVPIRFSSFNTTVQTILSGGNADVILITDLSGSMKYRIGSWAEIPGNAIPGCKESDLEDPNSRRLGIAGCLDSAFNDIVMNESIPPGNRLWLVDFADDANPFYTNDLGEITHDNIEQEIVDRYKSKSQQEIKGGTCICCAINQAYDIFDTYSDDSREKYLIVMTDGIPTYCCGGYWAGFLDWRCDCDGTATTRQWPEWWQTTTCEGTQADCEVNDCLGPSDSAINASRRLHEDLNVTIHAIGMGPLSTCSMANYTVSKIAEAGNGTYILSSNATELLEFYQDIAINIINTTELSSQKLIVKGNITPSILYGDSYIEYNFTPVISPVQHGEVPVYYQSTDFSSCSQSVSIPERIRVIDAKMISYSGPHWTDYLSVENSDGVFEVFNLSRYSTDYTRLGDPFVISIPPDVIKTDENNIFNIRTADSPYNTTGCSENNTLIYTALVNIINSTMPYSEVLPNATGCNWTIELEVGGTINLNVPADYSGSKHCEYTNSSHDSSGHDTQDSYDEAIYSFLSFLDYRNDGRVFINFNTDDLTVDAEIVRDVPYLWGPTIAEVRVWQ